MGENSPTLSKRKSWVKIHPYFQRGSYGWKFTHTFIEEVMGENSPTLSKRKSWVNFLP